MYFSKNNAAAEKNGVSTKNVLDRILGSKELIVQGYSFTMTSDLIVWQAMSYMNLDIKLVTWYSFNVTSSF